MSTSLDIMALVCAAGEAYWISVQAFASTIVGQRMTCRGVATQQPGFKRRPYAALRHLPEGREDDVSQQAPAAGSHNPPLAAGQLDGLDEAAVELRRGAALRCQYFPETCDALGYRIGQGAGAR